ncbi:hypothetical protein BLNAU_15705 [Blattamonas nauphoetae]|uniref:Uncharacterized protein n=1 Tax=Blattamonas nauphoetae TaxID=2049346 RepID=A0ABQ9XDA4_9EUKA|nr:hypothetical protein BLNAU_15705 [Blattamonas nauphoetae]
MQGGREAGIGSSIPTAQIQSNPARNTAKSPSDEHVAANACSIRRVGNDTDTRGCADIVGCVWSFGLTRVFDVPTLPVSTPQTREQESLLLLSAVVRPLPLPAFAVFPAIDGASLIEPAQSRVIFACSAIFLRQALHPRPLVDGYHSFTPSAHPSRILSACAQKRHESPILQVWGFRSLGDGIIQSLAQNS